MLALKIKRNEAIRLIDRDTGEVIAEWRLNTTSTRAARVAITAPQRVRIERVAKDEKR